MHKLIPSRTPWHMQKHLAWSNRKTMRTLGRKSPLQMLREKLSEAWFAAPILESFSIFALWAPTTNDSKIDLSYLASSHNSHLFPLGHIIWQCRIQFCNFFQKVLTNSTEWNIIMKLFRVISMADGKIARLCKGSTTDSDSVCEGSNPSPAARGSLGISMVPRLFYAHFRRNTLCHTL